MKFFFWKVQLVKKLLSFDFWISPHFVTIFRNTSTFLRQLHELFKNFFHICFYNVMLYNKYLSVRSLIEVSILLSIMWHHFLAKNCWNWKTKKKHMIVWSTKFYHSVNFGLKQIKTVKVVPWLQLRDPKVTSADLAWFYLQWFWYCLKQVHWQRNPRVAVSI